MWAEKGANKSIFLELSDKAASPSLSAGNRTANVSFVESETDMLAFDRLRIL